MFCSYVKNRAFSYEIPSSSLTSLSESKIFSSLSSFNTAITLPFYEMFNKNMEEFCICVQKK